MKTIATTTESDQIAEEVINLEIQSLDISLDNQLFTLQPMLSANAPVASLRFTDGEILISLLLSIMIILNIFGGIHNVFFGQKIKKQKYD